MKHKYKFYTGLFLLMLIAFFLVWVKGAIGHGKVEEISAFDIFNKGHYWPLLFGIIAPLAGIFFSFRKNTQLLLISTIACIFTVVNFYFLLIPYGDRIGLSSDEFRKILQNNLAIGFYLFAITSTVAVILSGIEYGFLILNAKKLTTDNINSKDAEQLEDNFETQISETNSSSPFKTKRSKSKILIAIILITLIAGGCFYWFMYKSNKIESHVKEVLKKYTYLDNSEVSFFEGSNGKILEFDDNVAKFIVRRVISLGNENGIDVKTKDDVENMSYKIRIEDNKKIYIDLISENGRKLIYQFIQTDLGETYLNGDFTFWAYDKNGEMKNAVANLDDLIYKKSELKPEANATIVKDTAAIAPKALDTVSPIIVAKDTIALAPVAADTNQIDNSSNQTTLIFEPFSGKINVGKSFFYDSPNIQTIRKGYLVENQAVDIKKEYSDFYYGLYTNPKGVITEGWLLKVTISKN